MLPATTGRAGLHTPHPASNIRWHELAKHHSQMFIYLPAMRLVVAPAILGVEGAHLGLRPYWVHTTPQPNIWFQVALHDQLALLLPSVAPASPARNDVSSNTHGTPSCFDCMMRKGKGHSVRSGCETPAIKNTSRSMSLNTQAHVHACKHTQRITWHATEPLPQSAAAHADAPGSPMS